ncbi:MAG: hypothetical protein R3258_07055 [Acidimicrobiia bacterium]|nr:hypothetical protein [Acidimicrobiia bacterium]
MRSGRTSMLPLVAAFALFAVGTLAAEAETSIAATPISDVPLADSSLDKGRLASLVDAALAKDEIAINEPEFGFAAPKPGEPEPELVFPGLSESEAEKAKLLTALYDKSVAEAMMEADRRYLELGDESLEPIRPALPSASVERGLPAPVADSSALYRLPSGGSDGDLERVAADASQSSGQSTEGACSGNCYQTDGLHLSDHPDDVYASDYWVWLAVPQSNETNKCDLASHASACFWFYAMQYNMDCCKSAIHIGPQRGSSLAGAAGSNWRMNIDGYNDGVHVGGQSSVNLPVATWIRVRTWRLSTGVSAGTPWAQFGVWAMWGGVDTYLGSVTINGTWIAKSFMFAEIYEANGQCSTDLERGYLDNARYQRVGTGMLAFAQAVASYEENCANTSWHALGGDFVRDERETPRVIPNGGIVW